MNFIQNFICKHFHRLGWPFKGTQTCMDCGRVHAAALH
jgi:hypothetical protein